MNVKSIWKQKPLHEVMRVISLLRRLLFSVCLRSLLYDIITERGNLSKEKKNVEVYWKQKLLLCPWWKFKVGPAKPNLRSGVFYQFVFFVCLFFLFFRVEKGNKDRPKDRPFAWVDHVINFRFSYTSQKFSDCNSRRKLEGPIWEKQLLPPSHVWMVFHTNPCKF